MDLEQSGRVGTLLSELIEGILPKRVDPEQILKYKSYISRILSSRLASPLGEPEENVVARLQDQAQEIASSNLKNDSWGQKRATRLQENIQRLSKSTVLKNRSAVLKVISALSNYKKDGIVKTPLFFQAQPRPVQESPAFPSVNGQVATRPDPRAQKEVAKMDTEEGKLELLRKGIVRELLFTFQGIESACIHFQKNKEAFELDPRLDFDRNEREIIIRLGEMGVLYQKIKNFLDVQSSSMTGLVSQSLCYAIKDELSEYYRFIATLENMRDSNFQAGGLSFKSLYLWTIDPMECLKWILIICDVCRPLKGGQILSTLFSYTMHGCPEIQHLVNRLLTKSLAPFMNFLRNWVYSGELVDPLGEFFIEMSKKTVVDKIWTDKYRLNIEMVPNFISRSTAEQILIAGKSKTFLRKYKTGQQWNLSAEFIKVENLVSFRFMEGLKFRALENWVAAVSRECNAKLKEVLIKEYEFFEHCRMIKNFLLLGKGDFINSLLEAMQETLGTSASKIFRHNLVSILDSVKSQGSLNGYRKDLLEKVGIFLFEQSVGTRGWDIFSLHYDIEPPLSTIFETESMQYYYRFFNLIWKIKYLIFSLSSHSKIHRRSFLQKDLPEDMMDKVNLSNHIRHQMLHFLNTFLSYIMLEVVETEWEIFLKGVEIADCLDEIIERHREFVVKILDKSLLRDKTNPLYVELKKLMETIERFNTTQSNIMLALESKQQEHAREKMDEESQDYDYDDDSQGRPRDEKRDNFRDLIKNNNNLISELWHSFRSGVDAFLEYLERDQKMKTLSFRLDFNEYYKNRRPTRKAITPRSQNMIRGAAKKMDTERPPPPGPSGRDEDEG
jgi:gamma-tubulin complex component 3